MYENAVEAKAASNMGDVYQYSVMTHCTFYIVH